MAQKNYFDITKVNGVTPEIIKEYKKLVRRERYLEELDSEHIVCRYGNEEQIYPFFKPEPAPELNPEKERKIETLYQALEMLHKSDETNYQALIDYYFTHEKTSYSILAKKYGVSKQTVYNRIQRAILFLRGAMIQLSKNNDKK